MYLADVIIDVSYLVSRNQDRDTMLPHRGLCVSKYDCLFRPDSFDELLFLQYKSRSRLEEFLTGNDLITI